VSLQNAAVGVGASRQNSKVSSKVLPVPLTDVCLSRSVRSGNNRHPGVVPWGTSIVGGIRSGQSRCSYSSVDSR
jgi:hypothetical protein